MLAVVLALAAYVAISAARTRSMERVGKALLVPALGTAALLARGAMDGASVIGSLRASALLTLAVLVVTLGEPDLIMDAQPMKAKARRRLPKADRLALANRERRTAIAQVGFITLVIIFAVTAELSPVGALFD